MTRWDGIFKDASRIQAALSPTDASSLEQGMETFKVTKCGIHNVSTASGRCYLCDLDRLGVRHDQSDDEVHQALNVARSVVAMIDRHPDGFTEVANVALGTLARAFIELHVVKLDRDQLRRELGRA